MTTVEVTLPVASSAHQQRPWKVNKTSGKKDCKKKQQQILIMAKLFYLVALQVFVIAVGLAVQGNI